MSVRAELPVEDLTVVLREAAAQDVPAIVQLLAADQLGAAGDGAPPTQTAACMRAYEAIHSDLAHLLLVVIEGDQVLATMQLSFLPGLARARCATRSHRGGPGQAGLPQPQPRAGAALFEWAIQEARRRDCALAPAEHRQVASRRAPLLRGPRLCRPHEGLKLQLGQ